MNDWTHAADDDEAQSSEATTAQEADTAVFYSISSTQKGLAGIDLGNFLIKQVAQRVLAEFPRVRMLVTLSPIPGFRKWLHSQVEAEMKQAGQPVPQVNMLNTVQTNRFWHTAISWHTDTPHKDILIVNT